MSRWHLIQTARAARPAPVGSALAALSRPETPLLGGVALLIGALALLPLGYLLVRTFFVDGDATLGGFREAYSEIGLGTMAANSAVFAAGSTALGMFVGTTLAYLVVRTDVPGRTLVFAAGFAPLAIPGVLYTIAWIFLASPRSGALNRLLEPVFGPGAVDVFGMGGMIVVEGLHLAPLAFLLAAVAFRSFDPALEESALASGARLPTVLRRVTLPLARPALLAAALILAVRALESFEVPALVGIPGDVWVFTSRIWRSLGEQPSDLTEAGAYSLSLLLVTSLGVFLAAQLSRDRRSHQTITGRARQAPRISLGRWRYPAFAFVLVYVVVAVVLPLAMLLYVSLQPFYRGLSLEGFTSMTFSAYRDVFSDDQTFSTLGNSLVLGVGAATAITALMALAAWLVVRTRVPGRRVVDHLAFLPIAIPGLVLGVALLFIALRAPFPLYGTLWLLLIAYVIRFMPYGMRYATASMTQIGDELEESARTSGAGFFATFRRILLPLALPGLAAGWITVLVFATRELSSSILLYSPGNEVLAILLWEQYESGRFPELAALGVVVVVTLVVLVALAYRLLTRHESRTG